MDTSRKINANAGKGGKYRPGEIAQNFGQPNTAQPGEGVSNMALIRSQEHGSTQASGAQPSTDLSGSPPSVKKPGLSVGNMSPHPAGDSGPSVSVASTGNIPPPGDKVAGRRGSPPKGTSSERMRNRSY